jgi:hypothetical protein
MPYRGRKRFRSGEAPAARTVCTYEVGVTELADSTAAIVLPAIPEVAPGKAAEDRRSAGIGAFPL